MPIDKAEQDTIKRMLGQRCASLVEEGMVVGLGTGTTATFFIQSLSKRCQNGLKIKAVCSSIASFQFAQKNKIPVFDIDDVDSIDLTIDGADEVDSQNRLIKGKGGALVREKILAFHSKRVVIAVDETKIVETLGQCGLPLEILPFGAKLTQKKLKNLGFEGKFRKKNGEFFISDNGNYILDIDKPTSFLSPEEAEAHILNLPGVVETGFFFNLATAVMIGYANGTYILRETL